MTLINCMLGEHIELSGTINADLVYGKDSVRGVNNLKKLMPTKADLNGRDLSKFQIVYPGEFVFNHRTSRNGSKFSIALNDGGEPIICTEDYVVFRIKESSETKILAEWLYMFFNRPEFDRYVITNSWGSSTEFYNWEDICSVNLELPSVSIQRKYVNIYEAMLANQKSYEKGLEDLKLVCDSTAEDFKKRYPFESIGKYVRRIDERNTDDKYRNVKNVSVSKEFTEVSSKVNKNDLSGYKIVRPRQISFVQTTHNEHVFCNAMNNTNDVILVTSVNEVFECDENKLLPEYLCINFNRTEFDRYARFNSWGSARETFTWADLVDVKIPIPPIKIQQSLADLFTVYRNRKTTNQRLKNYINSICPVLIKGSIEEAIREA